MDQQRFDDLLRAVTTTLRSRRTRRGTLAAVAALMLAATEPGAEAKKGKKPCKGGKTRCDGVCVNTQTDAANCGKCGKTCKNGKVCRGGRCVALCPPTLVCPSGQTCAEGECICPEATCPNATPPQADGVLPGACFCVDDPTGKTFCVPNLSCFGPEPPACGVDGSCPSGLICQDNGCGGNPTCVPTCALA